MSSMKTREKTVGNKTTITKDHPAKAALRPGNDAFVHFTTDSGAKLRALKPEFSEDYGGTIPELEPSSAKRTADTNMLGDEFAA